MRSSVGWRLVRIVVTAGYLLAGWILFTFSLEPGSILLGALSSIFVAVLTHGVFIEESEVVPQSDVRRPRLPRFHWVAAYLVLLLFQLYVSSFKVLFAMITGRYAPRVVRFRTRLRSDIARSALASSITMSPGTITLELENDHLVVHWLNARPTDSHNAGKRIRGRLELILRKVRG